MLSKLLGGPVKCYVPRCVLLELKSLGRDFSGACMLMLRLSCSFCAVTMARGMPAMQYS